jgi:hypothetical protein
MKNFPRNSQIPDKNALQFFGDSLIEKAEQKFY